MTGLNQVIEDTLSLIGHQLRLDEVQVETHFGELPALLANKNELQQVFTNLCLNARDAVVAPRARARKILVTTSLRRDVVEASVRDWGYGMSADVRDRVFEAFFTTKDEGKGTGLGLSVSCQLIQQHGGKIAVESSPGEGTVFTVSLPWAVSQE